MNKSKSTARFLHVTFSQLFFAWAASLGTTEGSHFKVIGIRPLTPVQNIVSLKLMQRKTLNLVINLPGVENITE